MRKKYRTTTIECEAEIDIDDYLDDASDDALLQEVADRGLKMLFSDVATMDDYINAICAKRSIIDSQKIKEFLDKL